MNPFLRLVISVIIAAQCAAAQKIEVSRSNKTIAVTVTDSASVEADTAILELGVSSYGASEDDAYVTNVAHANKVLDAITAAGVAKQDIETKEIGVTKLPPPPRNLKPSAKKQFVANQKWSITVSSGRAQEILDLAMQNGATEIEQPEWAVRDEPALEAKARAVALMHARAAAAEMAKGLGASLGELIYASNKDPDERDSLAGMQGVIGAIEGGPRPKLKLFPEKVTQSVTVHAVFSIN